MKLQIKGEVVVLFFVCFLNKNKRVRSYVLSNIRTTKYLYSSREAKWKRVGKNSRDGELLWKEEEEEEIKWKVYTAAPELLRWTGQCRRLHSRWIILFFFFGVLVFFFFCNGGDEPRAKNALANPMLLARVFRDSRGGRFLFLLSSKMLFALKLMGSFFFSAEVVGRWWYNKRKIPERTGEKRERCAKSTTRRMYHSRYNYFFFFVSLCTY